MAHRTSGCRSVMGIVLAVLLVGQFVGAIGTGGGSVSAAQIRAGGSKGGLIAYVGSDHNIWVMNADGSDPQRVTTDGANDHPYIAPSWSHDGTMLAFSGFANASNPGVRILRNGTITTLPNTERCGGPAFSADDTRVLYGCANGDFHESEPGDLATNPARGFISSSALDGSDQRIEVPYRTDGEMPAWDTSSFRGSPDQVDVSPVTGEIVAVAAALHYRGAFRFSPDGTLQTIITLEGNSDGLGPWSAHFMPDGQSLLVTTCGSGCFGATNPQSHGVVQLDLDGTVLQNWITPAEQWGYSAGISPSPDGKAAIVSLGSDGILYRIDPNGNSTELGSGAQPAWQPVDATFVLPDGTHRGAPSAGSPSDDGSIVTLPTPVPTTRPTPDAATPMDAGRIAYVGIDGNIWTASADGSDPTQITTDGTADELRGNTYQDPTWSHDGTMLVFMKVENGTKIVIWRDGTVTTVPGITGCNSAAFLPGDRQLALACGVGRTTYSASDPTQGMVSTVNLDGSDFQVRTAFEQTLTADNWSRAWNMAMPVRLSVMGDGTIVYSGVTDNSSRSLFTQLIQPDGRFGPSFFGTDGKQLSVHADASGTTLLGTIVHYCRSGAPNASFVSVNVQGEPQETLVTLPPDEAVLGADRSPDGSTIVYASTTTTIDDFCTPARPYPLRSVDIASGEVTDLGLEGRDPVWQPVPAEVAASADRATPGGNAISVPTASTSTRANPTASATATAETTTARRPTATAAAQSRTSQAPSALPTSGQLVYAAKDGGQWDLYLHDFGTNQSTQLTNQSGDQWAPAFSHDGKRLAYLSDADGSAQVWIMNPDGSNPVQVTFWQGADRIVYVDWSGDDRSLYLSFRGDAGDYVVQMPAGGGEMTAFLTVGAPGRPQVNPANGDMFFVTDANDGMTQMITFANEASPDNAQVLEPGDAIQLDPTGKIGVYQVGRPDLGQQRRIHMFSIDEPVSFVMPNSGYDDSNPVITGATTADHLLWVVDDGATQTIWSANLSEDPDSFLAAAVPTGHHDEIWYLTWRPSVGTTRTGA